jgi:hypothetical protein
MKRIKPGLVLFLIADFAIVVAIVLVLINKR